MYIYVRVHVPGCTHPHCTVHTCTFAGETCRTQGPVEQGLVCILGYGGGWPIEGPFLANLTMLYLHVCMYLPEQSRVPTVGEQLCLHSLTPLCALRNKKRLPDRQQLCSGREQAPGLRNQSVNRRRLRAVDDDGCSALSSGSLFRDIEACFFPHVALTSKTAISRI